MKKNRYKATRGKRQVFLVARGVEEAIKIGRKLLSCPTGVIKISYQGHA